jgi:hypothetical protein
MGGFAPTEILKKCEELMTAQTKIIDFHNHHIPARFELTATRTQPATQRARWEMLARKLPDEDLLLRDIREGHLAARVVNIPGNLIADENGHVQHQTIKAINDNLAELAARHPGRIYGLASVDGYDGDRSAREAERAITEGADNVLAGSDFPIAGETPITTQLTEAMQKARLSDAEQKAIAAGNCLRLLNAAETSARSNVHALAGGIP